LVARYPSVRKLAFTGKKAQSIFEKHFKHLDIEYVYLPSPSPAHATMRFDEKVVHYKDKLGIRSE
jgi:G:T/U-mismatch repair DNA glycosylase